MYVCYTDIKQDCSDSYSQCGMDADLVGVGSLKVGMAFFHAVRAQL